MSRIVNGLLIAGTAGFVWGLSLLGEAAWDKNQDKIRDRLNKTVMADMFYKTKNHPQTVKRINRSHIYNPRTITEGSVSTFYELKIDLDGVSFWGLCMDRGEPGLSVGDSCGYTRYVHGQKTHSTHCRMVPNTNRIEGITLPWKQYCTVSEYKDNRLAPTRKINFAPGSLKKMLNNSTSLTSKLFFETYPFYNGNRANQTLGNRL